MKFVWSKEHHFLDNPKMDAINREFIDLYNSVYEKNLDIQDVLIQLFKHFKIHFKIEEYDMSFYNYSKAFEHKQEHKKFLKEMKYFIKLSNSLFGRNIMQKYYREKLPEWFTLHLSNLDSDLSNYIKSKQKIKNEH